MQTQTGGRARELCDSVLFPFQAPFGSPRLPERVHHRLCPTRYFIADALILSGSVLAHRRHRGCH